MNLKILFTFYILTFFSIEAKSQYVQNNINKIDELGQKQGYWINYDLKIELQYFIINTFENECKEITELRYFIKSEGEYLNNRPIGSWSKYSICQNNYNKIEKISHSTSLGSSSHIDTSIIVGKAFILNDTVNIYCKDEKCYFNTSKGGVFDVFLLDSLNEKLKKLTNCEYEFAIKKSQYFYNKNSYKKNKNRSKN